MGRIAAEILGDLIDGVEPRAHRMELATELIVRESTAPVGKSRPGAAR